MIRRIGIKWKITLFSFCIVLFAICIGGIMLTGYVVNLQEEELGGRLLVTARTVAELPSVAQGLSVPADRAGLQSVAERIRIVNDVDYIVVMDMNGIRYTHPSLSLIGTPSGGTDERPSFAEHTYLSKAKGELGTALRAFVPVMNANRDQIGVVLVGKLLPKISEIVAQMRGEAYVVALFTLLFGVWGSWLLAIHIKKQMFNLEPSEIARLLVERTATFQAMHEGIIAIDSRENVTIFNEKAQEMLKISEDVVGKPIREVLPESRLHETLQLGEPVHNETLLIGSVPMMASRVPITVRGKVVGAVAVMQDRTEVAKMAEELTGVQAFVEALRVQSHEYKNKLHAIGGLLQLDNKQKAMDYLYEITEQHEELSRFMNKRIHSDSITGLLLGKISRGKELGIDVKLDDQSWMETLPEALDTHDMVVVLGNLLENAFEALQKQQGKKEVLISIEQDDEVCSLLVEDNGCGMNEETKARILERGYSTKGEGRGIGMYLVGNVLRKGSGRMKIESTEGGGTSIMITFPMKRNGAVTADD
ncbi:histidine kinase [Gordoniibacillus kamchatkensis]|uniref:histidine kinase n=1 Tax=Gordoniibacillus kamchatkensis TaxID=1590651 RepID=A0ABR5AG55_9BACL|nr:sensor histidine kinase [Paenibacillus sp. VKM B-2647]KIL39862.1 histidine kinase [Paenibacillus sp. VKM B-2647]